jgi:hypothetical protein
MARGPKKEKKKEYTGDGKPAPKRFAQSAVEVNADGLSSDEDGHEDDAFRRQSGRVGLTVSDNEEDDGLEDEEGILVSV